MRSHDLVDRLGHVLLRLAGLGGRDRDDLRADEGEDHDHHAGQDRDDAGGREAVVAREVGQPGRVAAADPEQEAERDQDEGDDGDDLDAGEPELELAERLDRREVDPGQQGHQAQRHDPQRQVDPALQDLGPGDGLDGEDDRPEVPVEPAGGEARPTAQRPPRVLGERAHLRVGDRHLAEHPHDQHDQQAGHQVGDDRRRPGLLDHRARADEQAGADHPAERDHRHVAGLQGLLELRCVCVVGHAGRLPAGPPDNSLVGWTGAGRPAHRRPRLRQRHRAAVDRHLPARLPGDVAGAAHERVVGTAHADRLRRRPRAGAAGNRAAERPAGTEAAAGGGDGDLRRRLAAVRVGLERGRAHRVALRPGAGGSRRHRDRPGRGARSALRRRGGAAVLVADAGHRAGTDPRPGAGRSAAGADVVGGHLRHARAPRRADRGARRGGPAGDTAAGAPQHGRAGAYRAARWRSSCATGPSSATASPRA